MPPAAVLRVLVEAAGVAATNRQLMTTHATLERVDAQASRTAAAIHAIGRIDVTAKAALHADTAAAQTAVQHVTSDVERFGATRATATIAVDDGRVAAAVARATREVLDYGRVSAEATAGVKIAQGEARIAQLRSQLQALDAEEATPEVRAQTTQAVQDLSRVQAELDRIKRARATVVVDVDTHDAAAKLAAVGGGGRAGAGGVNVLSASVGGLHGPLGVLSTLALFFAAALLGIAGPAIAVVAALAPLVGLLPALASGALAGAQGFGVLKLATLGVLDALKEQTRNAADAGGAAIKSAGQQQSAARAIAAAREGVRTATEGAAQATRQLNEAERNETRAIAALAPAYAEARRRLQDLRGAVTDTNLALRDDRIAATDARRALDDLLRGPDPRVLADAHDKVATAMRGETGAARELEAAQRALNDLLTPPDVLTIADAQDVVADALRRQTRAALELSDQVTATNAVMANPASTSDDQLRAQLALADAQNAVGDAARATTHAEDALKALQSPPDTLAVAAAQGRVADAQAAVSAAVRDTARAREDLAATEAGPSDDAIARARLAVARAEHDVSVATIEASRAARDYSAAEAAGVAGAPSVVAAREAVRTAANAAADAERALARSHHQVALAQQGVRDAQISAAASTAATAAGAVDLNAKLNALPPSAQSFVRLLVSMKDKATALRTAAADGFFPGAEDGLTSAARNFGPVERVIAATATVLGDLTRRAGELVGSGPFGRDLETVGMRNTKVLDTLGTAALHVVSAMRHVLVVVGPLTQWLADMAEKWSLNAAESAKAGRESGKMADFFDRTRAVLERVGSIIGHVTHGLFGFGKAGTQSGDEILESIDRASSRFDAWANSVGGQHAIQDFFHDTRDLAAALIPVVANMAQGFGILTLKLLPVAAALRVLGPFADEAVIAFLSYKLAVTAATGATALHSAAVWLMGTRLGAAALYNVAWRASAIASTVATHAMAAAMWLLDAAMDANPIGVVVLAIAALVAGLIYAYQHSEKFREIVDAAMRGVADAFGWVLDAASTVFDWLKEHWPLVLAILTGPIGLAVIAIVKHWDDIKSAFSHGIQAAIDAVKAAAGAIFGLGSWIVGKVVDGIKAAGHFFVDVGGWIKNRVSDSVHAAIDAVRAVGGWILGRIVDGIKTIGDAISSVGGWLKNRVTDFVHAEAPGLTNIGGWILNRVVDGIKVVSDALSTVGGWIKNRVGELLEQAKDGFLGFGGKIMGWIVGGLKAGANELVAFVNKIIGVINKIPGVDIAPIKGFAEGGVHATRTAAGPGAATDGLARGGAFARTGGIVDQPITLMGEEAPLHPEFVIPTNPSYRDRAQRLLARAARAIGLATGGRYSQAAMSALWGRHGGGDTAIAGAVGMAESGGDPNASNGPYHGLWQVGPGGSFDPDQNAIQGIAKWRAGGSSVDARWRPWQAYTGPDGAGSDGPWRKFIGGDSGGGGILGKIGGVVGDLLAKGAGFLLGKLPGAGDLPDWLKGAGRYVLEHAVSWIKDKVAGIATSQGGGGSKGADGVGTFDGVPMANWVIEALKYGRTHGAHGHPTSGYRPGFDTHTLSGRSEHQGTVYPHGAVDFGGYDSGLEEKMSYVRATRGFKYPLLAPIGFHDDGHASGTGHKTGGLYGVLGSFERGTNYVPKTGPYQLHEGERVTPAGGDTFEVDVIVDGTGELAELLKKMIRVEIRRDGEETDLEWKAGTR